MHLKSLFTLLLIGSSSGFAKIDVHPMTVDLVTSDQPIEISFAIKNLENKSSTVALSLTERIHDSKKATPQFGKTDELEVVSHDFSFDANPVQLRPKEEKVILLKYQGAEKLEVEKNYRVSVQEVASQLKIIMRTSVNLRPPHCEAKVVLQSKKNEDSTYDILILNNGCASALLSNYHVVSKHTPGLSYTLNDSKQLSNNKWKQMRLMPKASYLWRGEVSPLPNSTQDLILIKK